MGLFDFFKRKKMGAPNVAVPTNTQPEVQPPTSESSYLDDALYGITTIDAGKVESESIKKILLYKNQNFEEVGYTEALANPHIRFQNAKLPILQQGFIAILKEARYNFNIFEKEIDDLITRCTNADLSEAVDQLNGKKASIGVSLEFIADQEAEITQNNGDRSIIILGYKRGFSKGLLAYVEKTIMHKNK